MQNNKLEQTDYILNYILKLTWRSCASYHLLHSMINWNSMIVNLRVKSLNVNMSGQISRLLSIQQVQVSQTSQDWPNYWFKFEDNLFLKKWNEKVQNIQNNIFLFSSKLALWSFQIARALRPYLNLVGWLWLKHLCNVKEELLM